MSSGKKSFDLSLTESIFTLIFLFWGTILKTLSHSNRTLTNLHNKIRLANQFRDSNWFGLENGVCSFGSLMPIQVHLLVLFFALH